MTTAGRTSGGRFRRLWAGRDGRPGGRSEAPEMSVAGAPTRPVKSPTSEHADPSSRRAGPPPAGGAGPTATAPPAAGTPTRPDGRRARRAVQHGTEKKKNLEIRQIRGVELRD